ncbi:MAG: aminotransferase class IV [Cytophagales bacterium]|nr:aminotransferase class IV [Cytophagales bacterium]
MLLVHNSQFIDEEKVHFGLQNRGFLYGDGFFETMFHTGKEVRFLATHFERITEALQRIKVEIPKSFTLSTIENLISELLLKNDLSGSFAKVRLHAWRSTGGLYKPTNNHLEFVISTSAFESNIIPFSKKKATFYQEAFNQISPISAYKSLNASLYTLGSIYMEEEKCDEIIFLDNNHHISETLYSNIWWIKGNIIFTPSLKTGCIGGIMQKQLFKYCEQKNISLQVGEYSIQNLLEAESVFTSNASGLIGVEQIDNTNFDIHHSLFKKLQTTFQLKK